MNPDNKNRVPLEYYHVRFAALAASDISSRCGIPFNPKTSTFSLIILNQLLDITWPEFSMVPQNAAECPPGLYDGSAQILVLRYLTNGHYAPASGKFLSYRELPWGEVYDNNFQGRCIRRLAYAFGPRLHDFAQAAEMLGGSRLAMGDVAYEIPFFPELKIRLILRSGDDEFPPSSQFLFSDNTALAFSAEDLAVLGDVIIAALKWERPTAAC